MLVVLDEYSKYPEVEILSTLTAAEVIPKLEKVMATHGLIHELKTNNGPPFQSQELADYLTSLGIKHRRITPHWPQANGDIERFMRTLNKVIRIAHERQQHLELAIFTFLRNYRQAPHSTTSLAPGHLSMGRVVVDTIPHHPRWQPAQPNEEHIAAQRQIKHA